MKHANPRPGDDRNQQRPPGQWYGGPNEQERQAVYKQGNAVPPAGAQYGQSGYEQPRDDEWGYGRPDSEPDYRSDYEPPNGYPEPHYGQPDAQESGYRPSYYQQSDDRASIPAAERPGWEPDSRVDNTPGGSESGYGRPDDVQPDGSQRGYGPGGYRQFIAPQTGYRQPHNAQPEARGLATDRRLDTDSPHIRSPATSRRPIHRAINQATSPTINRAATHNLGGRRRVPLTRRPSRILPAHRTSDPGTRRSGSCSRGSSRSCAP